MKIKRFYPRINFEKVENSIEEMMEVINYFNDKNSDMDFTDVQEMFKGTISISKQKTYMIENVEEDIHYLFDQHVCYKEEVYDWEISAREAVRSVLKEHIVKKEELTSAYLSLQASDILEKYVKIDKNPYKAIIQNYVKINKDLEIKKAKNIRESFEFTKFSFNDFLKSRTSTVSFYEEDDEVELEVLI